MSTDLLRFIPVDPLHVPSPEAIADARALVRTFFPAAELISSETSDEVRFVDAGELFESVCCPSCGRELDVEWWQSAMERAFDRSFADLSVTMPCCGAGSSLHDLDYRAPAGFARFTLEVAEPGVSELTAAQQEQLEEVLQTKVRVVRSRY